MEHGQGLALPGAERGRNLMKAERWQQVNDLFQSAAERAPEERAAGRRILSNHRLSKSPPSF